MLVLKTECDLTPEQIEAMRKQIRERTGEDCIILTNGLTIERLPCAKDEAVTHKKTAPAD